MVSYDKSLGNLKYSCSKTISLNTKALLVLHSPHTIFPSSFNSQIIRIICYMNVTNMTTYLCLNTQFSARTFARFLLLITDEYSDIFRSAMNLQVSLQYLPHLQPCCLKYLKLIDCHSQIDFFFLQKLRFSSFWLVLHCSSSILAFKYSRDYEDAIPEPKNPPPMTKFQLYLTTQYGFDQFRVYVCFTIIVVDDVSADRLVQRSVRKETQQPNHMDKMHLKMMLYL